MAHQDGEPTIARPQVFALHWEGPARAVPAPEHRFPGSPQEHEEARAAERERELSELRRSEGGRALWEQIRQEARQRGDRDLWNRKLHAYGWCKLLARGSAAEYAERFGLNHNTVRSWISDVAKLAYQVGYRLHEDKLLLVGRAPRRLRRLRELVNRDAGSAETWTALREVEAEFRGEDPYFHLNEGHVLRARGRLRESDETLKEGLAIAEAKPLRSLLWNARGQTFWDCTPDSRHPLLDHLSRAERAFRRAALLDQSTYFPFVNLTQLAVDAGELRRAEYWVGELASARKGMDERMREGLARYLGEAEWTGPVEDQRFWRSGPARWLREAARRGVLSLAALLLLLGLGAAPAWSAPAPGGPASESGPGPIGGAASSGAGGN